MILISSAPQGPAVLERLVTGAIRLYVSGREVNVFPYTTERAPQARAPIENNSVQLLYEAAVAGGVAGRRGTFSIPAAIYIADAGGHRGNSEARHICVMGTD
eukprot:13519510-Heterocapsa_arctica.AAC.1